VQVPAVEFDFGEASRSLPAGVANEIVERLLTRTREANSELAYQVAINIRARVEGTIGTPVPMIRKEERDELWAIVNPLRSERPGDQWLDLLWQALHSARLEDHDPLELIRVELMRLGADEATVGPADAIRIKDRDGGYAQLEGSPVKPDFAWFGLAEAILGRLESLPDGAGPEAVRSEFHT
jgi:hypothetical protein